MQRNVFRLEDPRSMSDQAESSKQAHSPAQDSQLPEELFDLANELILACKSKTVAEIQSLLDRGAPAWYQDEDLGWSCLHYAAERRDPEMLTVLLKGGAVWNAVDHWGRTAGEVCLSLLDKEGWEVIRNEGVRAGAPTLQYSMGMRLTCRDATSSTGRSRFGRRGECDTSSRG